jgi:hypothetical protein
MLCTTVIGKRWDSSLGFLMSQKYVTEGENSVLDLKI